MSVMEAPSEEKLDLSNGEALCGMKYTHRGKNAPKKPKCVVCSDMFNVFCLRCGSK